MGKTKKAEPIHRDPPEPTLCRGSFRCTKCGAPGSALYQDPKTRKLTGFCYEHQPKKDTPCGKHRIVDLTNQVLYTKTALDVQKSLVEKLVIHKLNLAPPGDSSRRGTIVTLVPKKINNSAMAERELVEIIQYCYMLVGHHYAIHDLGKTGEQADCWVSNSMRPPYGVCVNHKYWGENQIDAFVRILLVLAEVHKWEVEDERMSLLERVALAAAGTEKK